jgi:hypothetical protein
MSVTLGAFACPWARVRRASGGFPGRSVETSQYVVIPHAIHVRNYHAVQNSKIFA